MADTVRVSFDVPVDEHTFLKSECAKNRIVLRDLLRTVFHNTVEELKKKKLHNMINQGFQNCYEGKTTRLTDEKMDKWSEMVRDE